MSKIIIFGVNGFTGLHLWELLKRHVKSDVIGTYHHPLGACQKKILSGCRLKQCDILDFGSIKRILSDIRPKQVYFLPAIVTVAKSFERAVDIYHTNVMGCAHFFEALVQLGLFPKVLLASSSETYGHVPHHRLPIKESYPLSPANPYGLSKALEEHLASYYSSIHRLTILTARTFHFSGPRQSTGFVIPSFARQIALAEEKKIDPVISVGNLKAKRDFTDIRDVVNAYFLLMRKEDRSGTFNICSGRSVAIHSVLNQLISLAKIKIAVRQDPEKFRKLDIKDFRGDHRKLIRKTGWSARFTLKQTLQDVLNEQRQLIKKGLHGEKVV